MSVRCTAIFDHGRGGGWEERWNIKFDSFYWREERWNIKIENGRIFWREERLVRDEC